MGIFYRNISHAGYSEDDLEVFVSALPGFQGTNTEWTSVEAIKNTDVFKAIVMIASDLAKMDIQVRRDGVIDENHELSFLLNKRPNNAYNGYKLKFAFFANALLNRNSYLEKQYVNNRLVGLKLLRPSSVTLKDDQREIYYEVTDEDGNVRKLNYHEVVDLSFYTLDGFNGLNIIDVLSQVLETDKSGKAFLSNFLKNGTHAGGILKMQGAAMNRDARNKVREEFQKTMSGNAEAGKVIVLDDTMEYQQLQIDTEVLKLIQNSKPSTSEVAKAFGIPLHKFGIETNNINIAEANLDYIASALGPYMKAISTELEFQLLSSEEHKHSSLHFDINDIRVMTQKEQAEVDKILLETGQRTLDEVRYSRGLPAVPGGYGSKHRVSLNFVDIDMAREYQEATMDNRLKGGGTNGDEQGNS